MNVEELKFFKKKGYLKYPKVLQLEITNKCPLNCHQCYKDINNLKDMDFKILEKAVSEAAQLGVKRIMINGGEPLLYPNLIEAIALMNKKGILPTCYTSGINLDDNFAQELKKLNVELNLSFNGSNEYIHNKSRDGFEITKKASIILKSNNVDFGINWVARGDNVHDFTNVINFAKKIGANGVIVVCNKLSGNYEINSPLNEEDFKLLASIIRTKENEKYVHIQNCNNLLATFSYNMPVSRLYGCGAGVTSCTMAVDGTFIPCPHLYYKEKFNSIKEYWENSEKLNMLRKFDSTNIEHCSLCKRNTKCRFCRAISLESHNDFKVGYRECPIFVDMSGGTCCE